MRCRCTDVLREDAMRLRVRPALPTGARHRMPARFWHEYCVPGRERSVASHISINPTYRSVSMEQTGSSNQGTGSNEIRNGVDRSATRNASAHSAVDRLASAARPAVDRLAETAHQTVDRVTTMASSAAGTLQQKREQLTTVSDELIDDARTYVRANPMAAIGIAAAVGFVLSRILKSR